MAQRIVFLGKGLVGYEDIETTGPLPANYVRLKATTTLVSTGTEGIVFQQLFAPGTHWDNWVKYPFAPGYSMVSVVQEVGQNVTNLVVGQRVVTRNSHRAFVDADAAKAVVIPDGVSDADASWFALSKIAFMAWKAGDVKLGDDILIIGAGPIGQMTLRWMVASGARSVIVLDPVQMRLDRAIQGGATATLAISAADADGPLRELLGGKLPDIVIDTTGHAAVFPCALALARDFGRVVLIGDTGTPSDQRLTGDLLRRGLTIVGAHDMHITPQWDDLTIPDLFFKLIQRGRLNLDNLTTHVFPWHDAVEAYRLMTEERAETLGVRFDWTV